MPREARKASITNIYHVMHRGINRQVIFEDDGDRHYFMTCLKYCKEQSGFRLHAFCLMPNHVHMLIEPAGEPLAMIYKRLGSKYVGWYNKKYHRVGHLFQDRFRSEPVNDERYFQTVLRYILQNPMKAGIESRPGSYPWSSYRAYEQGAGSITDTQYALGLFGGREPLIKYVQEHNDDDVLDEEDYDWYMREEQAKEAMERISGCATLSAFQLLDRPLQKEYAVKMYSEGLSASRIAMLTGMPKMTVLRTVRGAFPGGLKEPVFREEGIEFSDYECTEIW